MATIHREGDLGAPHGKVAVIGYGSQGHAHALNLHDSGVDVVVGLREGSGSRAAAEDAGLAGRARSPRPSRGAQVVAVLLPDHVQKGVWTRRVAPNLEPGARVLFAHGLQHPLRAHRAARGPRRDHGRAEGAGPPRARAVRGGRRHARASSRCSRTRAARRSPLALAYGDGDRLRRAPACSRRPSPRRPRATSSASRRCSAAASPRSIQAGFETLVEAGYQPEIAYYECLHELKLIVDLIYEGGFAYMRYSVSDSAEYGDLSRGPRVIDDHVRDNMRKVLSRHPRGLVRAGLDRADEDRASRG